MRECTKCGLKASNELELDAFVKCPESKYGRRNICRACHARKTDNSSQRMRDWKTDYQVKKRYGVDRETYLARMATSDSCQCCGSIIDLCYDHDHETMKFRGVLCRSCNRSIGQLGDDMESITNAYNYMRTHYEAG